MEKYQNLQDLFELTCPSAKLLERRLKEASSRTWLHMLRNLKGNSIGVDSRFVQEWLNDTDKQVGKKTRQTASILLNSLPEYMRQHPGLSEEQAMRRIVRNKIEFLKQEKTFVSVVKPDVDDEGCVLVSSSGDDSNSDSGDDSDSDSGDGFVVIGQEEQEEDQETEFQTTRPFDQRMQYLRPQADSRLNAAIAYCQFVQQRAKSKEAVKFAD